MKPDTQNTLYFEIPELPGTQHFHCDRLRATLSTDACGHRWKIAGEAPTDTRWLICKNCPVGAHHAGEVNANPSQLRAAKLCARCHLTTTRLINKYLCVSCYNRQREQIIGANAKGTKPVKLPPLRRRSISFLTDGTPKTRTVERSVDALELIVAVIRDEPHSVQFGWQPPVGVHVFGKLGETVE
ncbi:hypothetical protein [Paraburkholderia sp. Cpub6]|uniref:hypothetical protein n=1 Tax=Paraburkholderia sp. Cpub6 TaxID=2723094 RepID=UPI001615DE4F|nr:hypothetical protein [Paraburkholderia sp. Cpub6]MBB5456768.1 hypothetical protein [Paraburkholderia sp. Cpub6]